MYFLTVSYCPWNGSISLLADQTHHPNLNIHQAHIINCYLISPKKISSISRGGGGQCFLTRSFDPIKGSIENGKT